MAIPSDSFPAKSVLWPGCILASIGHAIFVARAPFMNYLQSWDGANYSFQDGAGSRGTIAFGVDHQTFVAVFYLEDSPRNPLRRDVIDPTWGMKWLQDLPASLKPLADVAAQYVLQDVGGHDMPVITAAFWSDPQNARFGAGEPWPGVLANGATLLNYQLLPDEAAVPGWTEAYEWEGGETALLEKIFARRIVTAGPITLLANQSEFLEKYAAGTSGLRECRQTLAEIGIFFSLTR